MRILIIEDSLVLREGLTQGLRHVGYAVDETAYGTEGLWLAQGNPYDLIVLDLMLPGLDGMSVLKTLRASKCAAGVLILTAKDQLVDKVAGLRQGADDFLVKPFAFEELIARIEAIIRRRHGQPTATLTVGTVMLSCESRTATVDGKPIELSPREYNLLEYMMRRSGKIVSRSDIEAHLYDQNAVLASNVVDAIVCSLRKKLPCSEQGPLIRTRRGMGYVLEGVE